MRSKKVNKVFQDGGVQKFSKMAKFSKTLFTLAPNHKEIRTLVFTIPYHSVSNNKFQKLELEQQQWSLPKNYVIFTTVSKTIPKTFGGSSPASGGSGAALKLATVLLFSPADALGVQVEQLFVGNVILHRIAQQNPSHTHPKNSGASVEKTGGPTRSSGSSSATTTTTPTSTKRASCYLGKVSTQQCSPADSQGWQALALVLVWKQLANK